MSAALIGLIVVCPALAVVWWQYRAEEARADRWEGEALLWRRRAGELGEKVYRLSVQLEEADAPLATGVGAGRRGMTAYVTTYPCDACDADHHADHQPPAVDCDRSHCAETASDCRVCVSHARDEARN